MLVTFQIYIKTKNNTLNKPNQPMIEIDSAFFIWQSEV